ncbi:M28 family peptidase [Terrarubrum flagellatum]|uniref:M28 family peptidase n=1 Tax=Terrirubrum flagellatum TaxID=2895980 RepID=UPI003144EF8D
MLDTVSLPKVAHPEALNETERRIIDAVSLDAPWSLVEIFAHTPRWKPEDVNAGADIIVEKLKALGVPVAVHQPTVYLSIPHDASIEIEGVRYRAKPPSSCVSTPDGLTAELVYLPANLKALRSYAKSIAELFGRPESESEKIGAQVKGRILVTEGFGNPALSQIAEEWGAVGLIAINPGVDIHWGTCTTVWGTPDLDDLPRKPKIPVIAVNQDTGKALKAAATKSGKATIRTVLQEGFFPQKVPVVEIKGAEEPDKFVLVHGHYDSWDVGVGDNATGDATLLELARVFWANKGLLKRSVRIAWWPGHSTGRYAGSTWFADEFAIDLDENCVAQINCDSPGCRWATSYHQTTTMSETAAHVQAVITAIEGGKTFMTKRPNRAGDYSFNNIGLSSYYMLSSTMPDKLREEKHYYDVSGCGGNIAWHTENDQLEIADKGQLLTDMRIYALSALRHANAAILPADWRETAKEFAATVARYATASKGLADLTVAKVEIDALAKTLDAFYASVESGAIKPKAANAAIQKLARILVPINFAREPRFRHDPAYTVPPLPTIAIAEELPHLPDSEKGFGQTQLKRGLNRLVAALREAQRVVEAAK